MQGRRTGSCVVERASSRTPPTPRPHLPAALLAPGRWDARTGLMAPGCRRSPCKNTRVDKLRCRRGGRAYRIIHMSVGALSRALGMSTLFRLLADRPQQCRSAGEVQRSLLQPDADGGRIVVSGQHIAAPDRAVPPALLDLWGLGRIPDVRPVRVDVPPRWPVVREGGLGQRGRSEFQTAPRFMRGPRLRTATRVTVRRVGEARPLE